MVSCLESAPIAAGGSLSMGRQTLISSQSSYLLICIVAPERERTLSSTAPEGWMMQSHQGLDKVCTDMC